MAAPLAYFITLRTYGTWLHGDERGSVDPKHNTYQTPLVGYDPKRHKLMRSNMRDEPFFLVAESALLVERTIPEVAAHRGWHLHIAKARTNHVHIVASGEVTAERMMNDFKAWSTRRLRENRFARPTQPVWAEHGSTPPLFTEARLLSAIDYVKNWQGGPLQKTWAQHEHAASASATRRARQSQRPFAQPLAPPRTRSVSKCHQTCPPVPMPPRACDEKPIVRLWNTQRQQCPGLTDLNY